mmetsp:Transcript_34093/g.79856  ORF Transcript_34093/g.79856 Transcript_34093/m.79856 type:complete len:107 (-) Transcript_34093:251-571(-)
MLLYTTRSVSSAPSSALAELPFVLGVLVALTNLVLSKRLPRRCSSQHGAYEWLFGVGAYFAAAGVPSCGTPFLNEVPLRFGIDNAEQHYHVPLLCSPWSYSTYRGS